MPSSMRSEKLYIVLQGKLEKKTGKTISMKESGKLDKAETASNIAKTQLCLSNPAHLMKLASTLTCHVLFPNLYIPF